MKHYFNYFWFLVSYFFKKTYTSNICNHSTKTLGKMMEGKKCTGFVTLPLSENKRPDYCIDCINKMAIRCAWCGEDIVIGEPVTLCSPVDSYKVPDYAVRYGEGNQFVGCLRWRCGDAMFRSGFWMPPGVAERVPSPFELCLSGPTGSVVFVENISDPDNIGTVFPKS